MALDLVSALSSSSNSFFPSVILVQISFNTEQSYPIGVFFFLDWTSQFLTPPLKHKTVHAFDPASSLSLHLFKSSLIFPSETIKTACRVPAEVFLSPYAIILVFDQLYWTYFMAWISDWHLFLFHNHTKQSSSHHSRHRSFANYLCEDQLLESINWVLSY